MMQHKLCPTCGSERIRRVRRDYARTYRGKPYVVPQLVFHECANCGEQVFSAEAMRKIESCRPAVAATA